MGQGTDVPLQLQTNSGHECRRKFQSTVQKNYPWHNAWRRRHLQLVSFPALSPTTAGIQEVFSVRGPLCKETTGAEVRLGAAVGAARGHPAASPCTAPGSGRSRPRVLGETSAKINLANPEEWPGAAATLQFQGD